MGQFDRIGLKSVGLPGLSDSDRGIGLPERTQPMYVETKKKPKPRPAPVIPPSKPPKNPPKGPTGPGPKNPKDGKDYKKDKDDNKGLTKDSRKEERKNPKPKDKQFKDSNYRIDYNRSMGKNK
jgi:hypothetical protein